MTRENRESITELWSEQGVAEIGAWILACNMFGSIRGPWPDDSWKGWCGNEPSYHTPVFVLTHHPRTPLRMAGGTEFRFVTEGIQGALEQATDAAGGRDIRLGGGLSTIRQYLRAALIDELHLAQPSMQRTAASASPTRAPRGRPVADSDVRQSSASSRIVREQAGKPVTFIASESSSVRSLLRSGGPLKCRRRTASGTCMWPSKTRWAGLTITCTSSV
jgi:dihydrofolate reductase